LGTALLDLSHQPGFDVNGFAGKLLERIHGRHPNHVHLKMLAVCHALLNSGPTVALLRALLAPVRVVWPSPVLAGVANLHGKPPPL
jgi:hypothetical protein